MPTNSVNVQEVHHEFLNLMHAKFPSLPPSSYYHYHFHCHAFVVYCVWDGERIVLPHNNMQY